MAVFHVICLCAISNGVVSATAAFPKDFIFASGTSAYQIEGAWNVDGKGENNWDHLVHTKSNMIHNHSSGDVACDSYHRYKQDVNLVKYIGFDMYRFSISWARILPNGDLSVINRRGINYYHKLIDRLLERGIQPMVTMCHFDMPQKLEDVGGWRNSSIVKRMKDYANILFKEYGEKVKWWITINEPFMIVLGYASEFLAPALNLSSPVNYIVGHNILKAHAEIYRLYRKEYHARQKGKISIALSATYAIPKTNSTADLEAAKRAMQFELGWFAHPIYSDSGGYAPLMRRIVDTNSKAEGRKYSRLPEFTKRERNHLRGSFDFFAVNHYTSVLISPGRSHVVAGKDANVDFSLDPAWPSTYIFFMRVVPEGIRELLRWIRSHYNNPQVFITENGVSDSGQLNDIKRIQFYQAYLNETLNAMHNYGCNVIGYTVWSLLDNFEWMLGYGPHFGIAHVDFEDPKRKRTLKLSAMYFKWLIMNKSNPDLMNDKL